MENVLALTDMVEWMIINVFHAQVTHLLVIKNVYVIKIIIGVMIEKYVIM